VTTILLVLVLSYLLGSLPTSIVVGRVAAGLDIREHGSGNAGATNVYRVLGLGPAVLTGVVDVAKGSLAVLVISGIHVGTQPQLSADILKIVAGGAAVAGHIWTVFAGFRGGKGMATAIGALLFIAPAALGAALGVWLILLFTVRIMSIASLSAAIILPLATWIWETGPDGSTSTELLWFSIVLSLLIFFTHRANIGRILRGEEKRLGRNPDNGDSGNNEESGENVGSKQA